MRRLSALAVTSVFVLSACSSITPDKPVRASLFDLGLAPVATDAPASRQATIVLADIDAPPSLESSALLYRLAYADAHELHPYSRSRWSAPPSQLVRQRLREVLGRDRAVLDFAESGTLARTGGAMPRILRVDVEEFSHVFESQAQSFGVVRMRVTLMENTPAGERLLAQRVLVERQPAPSPDASGGVRALAAATDAAAQEIGRWLAQQP